MKIVFEDGKSYLELEWLVSGEARLILCSAGGYKKTTMVSVPLNLDHLEKIRKFIESG